MRWSELAVGALAVSRGAQLITEDEVTRPIRDWTERRHPDSRLNYLLNCRECVAVWVGLGLGSGLLPRPVSWALALSRAAALLEGADERLGVITAAIRRRSESLPAAGGTGH